MKKRYSDFDAIMGSIEKMINRRKEWIKDETLKDEQFVCACKNEICALTAAKNIIALSPSIIIETEDE